ncbi:MAG: polymer-forming cytoskeletal protein [Patescibacteria group bacterium]|nr:polymer-forming cytoskeletal protein [Patescibacteria group bacterium]
MKTKDDFAEFTNPDTIIGEGVAVEGTLKTLGDIQINGTFKGKLMTEGDVVVGEHATVEADINAENVHVAGTVIGNVSALHKLEVLDTGEIDGNVSSSALVIEAGGVLKGTSKMHETEAERPDIDPTYEVEEGTEVEDQEEISA